MATPAVAAPTDRAVTQTAVAANNLVAALVQVNNVRVVSADGTNIQVDGLLTIGDITVSVEDVLNNNTVLQDFLNNNNVDIDDVVDIAIVRNTLIVVVDAL